MFSISKYQVGVFLINKIYLSGNKNWHPKANFFSDYVKLALKVYINDC